MFPRIWAHVSQTVKSTFFTLQQNSVNSHTGIKERKMKKKQDSVVEHRLRQTSLNRCLNQFLYFLSKPWGKKYIHLWFRSPPASALGHIGVAVLLP